MHSIWPGRGSCVVVLNTHTRKCCWLYASSNYTTKRHRTDRNRDTPQTTERRHEHTEQATGQVQVQVTHTTHHSDSQPPSHSDSTGRRQAHPLARAGRPTYCVHAPASLWVAPLTVVGAGVRASLRSKHTHTTCVSRQ